jgi:hypothetical protein
MNIKKLIVGSFLLGIAFSACEKEASMQAGSTTNTVNDTIAPSTAAVLLVIDEQSIDNGNQPNNFSETDVNDQFARPGLRETLRYFKDNTGKVIDLYTGEMGDEGWHAFTSIPASWKAAGTSTNGAQNFLQAAPGLGGGSNNPEVLLDKVPGVTPLRATGLKMLVGQTVLAVVYDGSTGINYAPLYGNLQGSTLGIVAMQVLAVNTRTDGSSGSLPGVKVKIVNTAVAGALPLKLFGNAPAPVSSSVPFDVVPPVIVEAPVLTDAL